MEFRKSYIGYSYFWEFYHGTLKYRNQQVTKALQKLVFCTSWWNIIINKIYYLFIYLLLIYFIANEYERLLSLLRCVIQISKQIWMNEHKSNVPYKIVGNTTTLQSFYGLCLGLSRWAGIRRINHSGFCWNRDDGVAVKVKGKGRNSSVASAGPYASHLHLAPNR